jgi:Family of unknown function (DUF6011)
MYENLVHVEQLQRNLEALYSPKPRLYNGEYTLTNVETGEHRTFKISTQAVDSDFAPGERVLSLLTGSNNETDYTSFAFVCADNQVRVWKSKRGIDGKKSAYEFYAYLISQVLLAPSDSEEIELTVKACNRTYAVQVSKRCVRCNHKLTSPESIKYGIGPICADKAL